MRFENQKALITGAGSGIGRAAALRMASEGADIAFTYRSNRAGAEELRGEIEGMGRRAWTMQVDVTEDAQIEEMADRLPAEFGPVDILVNNAGGLVERMTFFEITKERWEEILALNLWSVLKVSQLVGAGMKERGRGVIVNNASVAGRFGGGTGALVYSVAKGALITMTQSMGKELIAFGIRVNAIAPGIIDTPFHDKFTPPDVMQSLMTRVPIARPGTAEEMAGVIAFLASADSAYLVGATVDANGGMWVI